jgi:hypothetical protein
MSSIKILKTIFLFAVVSAGIVQAQPEDIWDASTNALPFFSKNLIRDCIGCVNYIIIASDRPISAELEKSVKNLASLGPVKDKTQAAVIRRNQVIDFANMLVSLRCPLPGKNDRQILFFADVQLNKCLLVPYSEETVLRTALEVVFGNLSESTLVVDRLQHLNLSEQVEAIYKDVVRELKAAFPQLKELIVLLLQGKSGAAVRYKTASPAKGQS